MRFGEFPTHDFEMAMPFQREMMTANFGPTARQRRISKEAMHSRSLERSIARREMPAFNQFIEITPVPQPPVEGGYHA